MFAKLTALVGGGYTFPYNLEEPYPSTWGMWTHYPGTHKDDGSRVSVFKISATDPNDRQLVIARNGVKRLKLLRHPNVLAFKDSIETTEKGATVIYLITEPVRPLKQVMQELDLTGQHRDDYLAMGFLHMTNAVSFLNNDCKMIHGNLCLEAVAVTDTLDWKLHGFDLLSEVSSVAGDCPLKQSVWMVGNQYKAAELGKSEWEVISQSPPWAVDAWGLGCLMQEVFSVESMTSVEQLRRTDCIPPALLSDYQKLLSSNPTRRLNPAKVAESKFLNNRLVDVVHFMENIAVKDGLEKDTFFKRLPSALPSIPSAVAVRKILPLLSSALEFGGAPAHAVGSLMLIAKQLESEEFNKRVVPCLSKLFMSSDRNLRRSLLESIDSYGQHLTTPIVEDMIFPHLQTGFADSNAYIRELTLKSMLTLAPKLTNKTLVNNVLKHLSKLQVDEEPSIRANTTVLLGNVSKYLGEATCKRVLLNAFTRALKDAFPPAKIAGLRAMVATHQYYSPEDAALRIFPSVAPLATEPVGEVRQAALQCLDHFLAQLKDHDKAKTAEAEAAAASGVPGEASQQQGGAPTIGAGSMLTWAVSGLMGSLATAKSGPVPPGAGAAASGSPAPGGAAAPGAGPSVAVSAARPTPSASRAATSSTGGSFATTSAPVATASNGKEGWDTAGGDADGWDDEELQIDEEEVKARSRLMAKSASAASSGSRAAVAPVAPAAASSGSGGGGWDMDDDLGLGEPLEAKPAAPTRPPPRRPASRSATSASAGSDGGAAKKGALKLGAQKLGASKLTAPVVAPGSTGGSGGGAAGDGWGEEKDGWDV